MAPIRRALGSPDLEEYFEKSKRSVNLIRKVFRGFQSRTLPQPLRIFYVTSGRLRLDFPQD